MYLGWLYQEAGEWVIRWAMYVSCDQTKDSVMNILELDLAALSKQIEGVWFTFPRLIPMVFWDQNQVETSLGFLKPTHRDIPGG